MGKFSDDGQWWWDGTQWIATSQVILPDLPTTEFERSGKLERARANGKTAQRLSWWRTSPPLAMVTGIPLLTMVPGLTRDLRSWRLEQLTLATAHLLGPDELMLAGESATLAVFPEDYPPGGLAVAVTAAHVLVFRVDLQAGQPRWIALASSPTDVKMELHKRLLGLAPGLTVIGGRGQWSIRGVPGIFKPEPVLDAWRQAAHGKTAAG